MKYKILLLVLLSFFIMGCPTTPKVPVEPSVVYVQQPLKDPLPHPTMPILEIPDGEITVDQVMGHTVLLNGAIQKLQILVEIYEREDRKLPDGYGNKKYEGMTLEQLKAEYLKLLGIQPTAELMKN